MTPAIIPYRSASRTMSALPHPAGSSQQAPSQSAPTPAVAEVKAPQQAKQPKEKKDKKAKDGASGLAGQMASLELSPSPDFIQHRIELFDQFYKEYNEYVAAQPRVDIAITLPDGKAIEGKAWETSPMDIAKSISALRPVGFKTCSSSWDCIGKSLPEKVVIAKV